MCFRESRTSAIVEGDLPDLPFVCSNIRFAHYVLAALASMLAALPTPHHVHMAAGPPRARSCHHDRPGRALGMN